MRVEGAAEGRPPLYIEDLPPIKAPRFSWWADELASAVDAAGAAKPPKKRSISDLFDPAPALDVPPGGDSGCNEQTEVDGDEALCTIVRQAKEEKWKRRRLGEEAAATATPENTGGRETEGNFAATKVRDPVHRYHNPPLPVCQPNDVICCYPYVILPCFFLLLICWSVFGCFA